MGLKYLNLNVSLDPVTSRPLFLYDEQAFTYEWLLEAIIESTPGEVSGLPTNLFEILREPIDEILFLLERVYTVRKRQSDAQKREMKEQDNKRNRR